MLLLLGAFSFFRSPRVCFSTISPSTQVKSTHMRAYTLQIRFTHTETPYMCSLNCLTAFYPFIHSFIHSSIRFYIFAYVCSVTSEDGMLSYICGGLFVLNIFTVRQFSSKRRSVLVHLSECIINFRINFFPHHFVRLVFLLSLPRLHIFLSVACCYF